MRRMLMVVAVLVVAFIALVLAFRRPLPACDRATWSAARERWRANEVADYRIAVRVSGRQAATYEAEVRGGEVQWAKRNGQPLKQSRTLGTWSIPGMFITMQLDLDSIDRAAKLAPAKIQPTLTLRARFHAELGYPLEYHRIETGSGGSNPEVYWKVERFEVLSNEARDDEG